MTLVERLVLFLLSMVMLLQSYLAYEAVKREKVVLKAIIQIQEIIAKK